MEGDNRKYKKSKTNGLYDLIGSLDSDSEFRAPEATRSLSANSNQKLVGMLHFFEDGSSHAVLEKLSKEPMRTKAFAYRGIRCCYDEEQSIMRFRKHPELYPKLYTNGVCNIAEIGAWPMSVMRKIALNHNGSIDVHCLGCSSTISMKPNNCANGCGPCVFCSGSDVNKVLYQRSFQSYLDEHGMKWTTVPDAREIFKNSHAEIQINCTVCNETFQRSPHNMVSSNLHCPGCSPRHRAELTAFKLYTFVITGAVMYPRGLAVIEGVHKNPFDIASRNYGTIIEIMSIRFHIRAGKIQNDIEKMLAALQNHSVYIVAHCEDFHVTPARVCAWKRCVVRALRQSIADPKPRLIHVRRDESWNDYDSMRDAALAAGFSYADIFCGDVNACADEHLPAEQVAVQNAAQKTILDFFQKV